MMQGIQYVVPRTEVKCLRLGTIVQARRWKVTVHKIAEYLEKCSIGMPISWNTVCFAQCIVL